MTERHEGFAAGSSTSTSTSRASAPPGDVLPTPCLTCGAPMTLREATALHANPTLHCEYCGREEALPTDANERHRLLRLRLLQVKRARETTEAPLTTMRMLRQSWTIGLVAMAFPAATQAETLFGDRARALPFETVLILAASAGVFVGIGAGYVGMMRVFARLVRPLLRARPPEQPGLHARCRTCGATLPPVRQPEVVCPHCAATNLLDEELTRHAALLLGAEAEAYRRRAAGVGKPDPQAYLAPTQAFYRWGLAGGVVGFAVAAGVAWLLRSGVPTR